MDPGDTAYTQNEAKALPGAAATGGLPLGFPRESCVSICILYQQDASEG